MQSQLLVLIKTVQINNKNSRGKTRTFFVKSKSLKDRIFY